MGFILCVFLFLAQPAEAEGDKSLDWYHDRATEAITNETYETAVKIIEEGKEQYPLSPELNIILANLYYDKELYNPALNEYLEADEKGGEDFYTLNQISRCYGKLNQVEDSIQYLKKILKAYPDSVATIDDLGWMYFKTHQLEKGEELLLDALNRYEPDRGIYMTLGTLYSGMYDYESSKRFYLKAIEEAHNLEDEYFASVAYYNLSLLEHSFYYYNSALRYTEESINSADRASGHLARGELYQSRMDFRPALSEYQKSFAKDTTPLSRVNLAILYQKFGLLEHARRYAEEVLLSKDLAWMYYYGTDLDRHYKDVHELLADIYQGLARIELMKAEANLFKRAWALILSLRYRLIAYYHRQKFRLYSIRVGKAYLEEKNFLDAYWEFYKGNEKYRNIALKYLTRAREIETQIVPHSDAYYRQEEGKLLKSANLIKESISAFDPFWEKEGISDSLKILIPLLKRNRPEYRKAINKIYEINPGGLLQYGFGLPLEIEIIPGEGSKKDKRIRHIVRFLKRAGSEIAHSRDQEGFKYLLLIHLAGPQEVTFRLKDRVKDVVICQGTVNTGSGSARKRAARCVKSVVEKLYSMQ